MTSESGDDNVDLSSGSFWAELESALPAMDAVELPNEAESCSEDAALEGEDMASSYNGRKPKWWRKLAGRRGTRAQRRSEERMVQAGYCVPHLAHGSVLGLAELFHAACDGQDNMDITLEIGFGDGENLLANARKYPSRCFLGAEVHRPSVCVVLRAIEATVFGKSSAQDEGTVPPPERGFYQNVRIYGGDGIKLLRHIPPQSLTSILLTYPDPWPKDRQRPWRVVQQDTVQLMERALRHDGCGRFLLATDHAGYAEWTRSVFQARRHSMMQMNTSHKGLDAVKVDEEGTSDAAPPRAEHRTNATVWEEEVPPPSRQQWLPMVSKYEAKGDEEGKPMLSQCWNLVPMSENKCPPPSMNTSSNFSTVTQKSKMALPRGGHHGSLHKDVFEGEPADDGGK